MYMFLRGRMKDEAEKQAADSLLKAVCFFICRFEIISDAAFPSYFTVTIICGRDSVYSSLNLRIFGIDKAPAGQKRSVPARLVLALYQMVVLHNPG